jgi:hypothetical protein
MRRQSLWLRCFAIMLSSKLEASTFNPDACRIDGR